MCLGKASGHIPCPKGKYASNPGGVQCFKCAPGKYADIEAAINCKSCTPGLYQTEEGSTTCSPCPRGTYSESGASECTKCDLGKYGRDATCMKCPSGLYSDIRGTTTCFNCTGSKIPNAQATACEKPPWKMKEDCKLGEYLDDSSPNRTDHSCETCMYGADCSRITTFSSLKPKKGYKSMSWNTHIYGACLIPGACNGTCTEGHSGELCSECISGFATTSKQRDLCARCPSGFLTALLFLGGHYR